MEKACKGFLIFLSGLFLTLEIFVMFCWVFFVVVICYFIFWLEAFFLEPRELERGHFLAPDPKTACRLFRDFL